MFSLFFGLMLATGQFAKTGTAAGGPPQLQKWQAGGRVLRTRIPGRMLAQSDLLTSNQTQSRNPSPVDQYPFNTVGLMSVTLFDEQGSQPESGFCTGALIGPQTVLTAAHCLRSATSNATVGTQPMPCMP